MRWSRLIDHIVKWLHYLPIEALEALCFFVNMAAANNKIVSQSEKVSYLLVNQEEHDNKKVYDERYSNTMQVTQKPSKI